MLKLDSHSAGRHFLHIPGPSPVPARVLRAISYQTIDHRGPEFGQLGLAILENIKKIFKTKSPVIIYPSSGTGAWEGALVNTLSPGDLVLMYETGQFATLWKKLADRLGLKTEFIGKPGAEGWRYGVDAAKIEERLKADTAHEIKAVCVVHNETSTGVTSNIKAVRQAMDAAKHPALLLVDTISGLGSADYCHDDWGVDVTISGSQKGLMLPPGIGFNALSTKAIEASKTAKLPKAFWAWDEILESNKTGYWPTTPSTNLMYGLHEAMEMILAEGLDHVFARHQRLAKACRAAVEAWGLEIQCQDPAVYSPVLTGVVTPDGVDADQLRKLILERYNLSLGTGLGKVKGRMFRIGHLGDCNELSLLAALSGCEMGMKAFGIKLKGSGVVAAQEVLQD
ncbi:pyridoxal-phosphate-dependent aminotransferase family protein [Polynucleobacter sphagniphilus]|uniref:Alanine-glyoxylate transaminase/serine-glyoxylate transaminase/serine-pyruvate transaminase n=1 Tax=Polynucleobacter sphagniphilus TaxID=1743169 RepID=A0AA43S709_9BURK|nr:aminotransferase class V-fold PLP-dependent enzyme [Polynucleobacter sphagniphilus]MDF9788298.1 alanine-glyoxylate transaminase/serine-glyoxylate transaminase/serine-pyruvate transaminase [Polynucleobacter sphagniphilus]MDH6154807.1 alanine-glyoxylate transaminase/serine-glyoxylate transaminase/serine-pyruvate transaminase [Polynucleobacter sphagniphilus]MDH6241227.1 alanine-glyoxylate transaminase/serine-glyoxylate transaminase/serine-pyruvate transaminase [Polynucleobacter sphagniphilus]MD